MDRLDRLNKILDSVLTLAHIVLIGLGIKAMLFVCQLLSPCAVVR